MIRASKRNLPSLLSALALGLSISCANEAQLATDEDAELRARCFSKFSQQQDIKSELQTVVTQELVSATECEEFGELLESIQAVDATLDGPRGASDSDWSLGADQ